MKVKLSDIINAMDFTDQYTEYLLDMETGEIAYINDMVMSHSEKETIYEQMDEHGFYRLPDEREMDDYSVMEAFISTLSAPAAEKLSRAIRGHGAFRRFKEEIIHLGVEKEWYAFKEDARKRIAIRWCEENGLEWE